MLKIQSVKKRVQDRRFILFLIFLKNNNGFNKVAVHKFNRKSIASVNSNKIVGI